MAKKIVVGSDQMPNPEKLLEMYEKLDGQTKEIRNQFRRGVLAPRHVQALIEHRNPFEKNMGEAEMQRPKCPRRDVAIKEHPEQIIERWAKSHDLSTNESIQGDKIFVDDNRDTSPCSQKRFEWDRTVACPNRVKREVCEISQDGSKIILFNQEKLAVVKQLAQQLAQFNGVESCILIRERKQQEESCGEPHSRWF